MYHFDNAIKMIHRHLQRNVAVGEYELIQVLDKEGVFAQVKAFSASLQLFHKHFVTMHCLYRLQEELYPQRLDINPLSVRLYPPTSSATAGTAVTDDVGVLRSYYLDLSHLKEANDHSVAELLHSFWARFDAHYRADESFAALGLSPSASWHDVKTAYRQQVQHAHPDKGGCPRAFALAREAYQTLKPRFR